jgi:hypothetical protein
VPPLSGKLSGCEWEDLASEAPRLASVAYDRLVAPGVLVIVTIRRDGTPRLSPRFLWCDDRAWSLPQRIHEVEGRPLVLDAFRTARL